MPTAKPPKPAAQPNQPVTPDQSTEAKQAAADAKTNEKRRSLASSSEGSFGYSPAALGGAPTKAPQLKAQLG